MKKSFVLQLLTIILIIGLIAGCATSNNGGNKTEPAPTASATNAGGDKVEEPPSKTVSGEITVLTARTDIVNTILPEYAKKFNEKFPDVKVKFEALQDYEGQIKIRMNTKDYGDVLYISPSITNDDIPDFFEPLGAYDELKEKYMLIEDRTVDGQVYGIPIAVTVPGVLYNKRIFNEAGVTEIPKTPAQFLEALQKVKDNTEAIPLYTNYAAGWPLTQWQSYVQTASGDIDYPNIKMLEDENPFAAGKPIYDVYKLLNDAVKNKLVEDDPFTTDWESSKVLLNEGKIATMVLGSWAISQVQGAGPNPQDVGYMPFPTNAAKLLAPMSSDYKIAVNKNSKNKEAALAWLWWQTNDSDYASALQSGFSALKGSATPEYLKPFEELGAELVISTVSPDHLVGMETKIDNEGEIGLWADVFKKRIVESAVGNTKESYDDIMSDLGVRWAAAKKKVMP